jgi:glycolate oxidase iron-sulfur subunit
MPEPVRLPARDPLVALADQCVQCGLCLPACPTYTLDRLEAESPRGRIALARAWALGTIPTTGAGDIHLDHCLGCRRCEVVCPANVQYGALLLQARARQRERRRPGRRQRLLEWLAARPRLLGLLLSAYRHAWPLLPARWRPLPRPPAAVAMPVSLSGAAGDNIAIFNGCVARGYESGVHASLARLAAACGVAVRLPDGQACCGTLHAHAGDSAMAAALAARNRVAFTGSSKVLTLASGCHEAVADALRGSTAVEDALAYLAARAGRLRFRETRQRVALHLPCTQRNVVHSDAATRALLARVPGLDVVVLDAGGCCGAAGTQMLAEPARAARYRQPLLDQLAASGATRLLSANIGCRLHFANGTRVPVQHPLEYLAQCLDTETGSTP